MSRFVRSVMLVAGIVAATLAGGCESRTVDAKAAKPPSLAPQPVPSNAGPTRIPAGLLLPDEGETPRSGGNWYARRFASIGAGWPFDPCFRAPGQLEPIDMPADGRTISRREVGGVQAARTLAVFTDTDTANRVMADLRRALTECHSGTTNGTWVWESRDRPGIGDDAVETKGQREYNVDRVREYHIYLVVQVRNAVLVVSASAGDITRLPDVASIDKTASDAVDSLHRAGWP